MNKFRAKCDASTWEYTSTSDPKIPNIVTLVCSGGTNAAGDLTGLKNSHQLLLKAQMSEQNYYITSALIMLSHNDF